MSVLASLSAAFALLASVLLFEGLTRGGRQQRVAGLACGVAALLAFTLGDALPTFDWQNIDTLPRWRDVAHATQTSVPASPRPQTPIQSANAEWPAIPAINYHPTPSPLGNPRFLAVYPREKFMSETDWKAPPSPTLNVMYDALIAHEWDRANTYAQTSWDSIESANLQSKNYYQLHLTWVRGIALMESGKPAEAVDMMNEAAKLLTYGNSGADDAMRFQIDREIVNLYARKSRSVFMRDLMPDLLEHKSDHLQEIALLHYVTALRAAKDGNAGVVETEMQLAKLAATEISLNHGGKTGARLMTIFNDPFGGPGHELFLTSTVKPTTQTQPSVKAE